MYSINILQVNFQVTVTVVLSLQLMVGEKINEGRIEERKEGNQQVVGNLKNNKTEEEI